MPSRHPKYWHIKHHRPYTTEELAAVLGTHKNTVRRWMKSGLRTIDERRPYMVRGIDAVEYLKKKREESKRLCGPGEFYCLKCRASRKPAGGMADLQVKSPTSGSLAGICSVCERMIYRRVNPAKLDAFRGLLDISIREPADV